MRKIYYFFLFMCLFFTGQAHAQKSIYGYVKDSLSNEPLIDAYIRVYPSKKLIKTNEYGYFTIKTDKIDSLVFTYVGYNKLNFGAGRVQNPIQIKLKQFANELQETTIYATTERPIEQIGLIKISSSLIKQIPSLGGEKDLLKAIQMMPGVQKGAEGSTALYVRGGGGDQNLILLDEAVVYNPNHFFGFFSVFNADAIKNVNFYKSSFPIEIGGRLSSIISIQQKEGNKSKVEGAGSIGFLTSKLTLEGPLKKEKSSFILSLRRTNLDPFLKIVNSPQQALGYNFYDINAKVSLQINNNNKVFISAFTGRDALTIGMTNLNKIADIRTVQKSSILWGNSTATVNWFSILPKNSMLSTVLTYTKYNSSFDDNIVRTNPIEGSKTSVINFGSGIQDLTAKSTITVNSNINRETKSGLFFSQRYFLPKIYTGQNVRALPDVAVKQFFNTTEAGAFLSEKMGLTSDFKATFGLRYTLLSVPNKIYNLLEPRVSFSYQASPNGILKAAYDRTTQTVNLLQSSGFGLSTDLYVPSTSFFRPQTSNQFSMSYERGFKQNNLFFSVESYLKRQNNILGFKEGVSLFILGDNAKSFDWEENITSGKGLNYGVEFNIRKPQGKLTGSLSYTLAKAIVKFEDLNNGKPFSPFQDRRHDVSIFTSYKINRRLQLSANWILTTGFPISLPLGYYQSALFENNSFLSTNNYYGFRNFSRMPTYHRLDLSLLINPKKKRRFNSSWEFGIFNVYNRKNAFNAFLQIDQKPGSSGLKVAYGSLLPIVPSINYNFNF